MAGVEYAMLSHGLQSRLAEFTGLICPNLTRRSPISGKLYCTLNTTLETRYLQIYSFCSFDARRWYLRCERCFYPLTHPVVSSNCLKYAITFKYLAQKRKAKKKMPPFSIYIIWGWTRSHQSLVRLKDVSGITVYTEKIDSHDPEPIISNYPIFLFRSFCVIFFFLFLLYVL